MDGRDTSNVTPAGATLMWPWEHLAIGYLAYSAFERLRGGRPRTGGVVAVAFGTQFPDLVDKPLGWGTSLLPSGNSLAHSLLFAVPVVICVLVVTRRLGAGYAGTGFGLGYLFHLPADALYPLVFGEAPRLSFLLWPLVPVGETAPTSLVGRLDTVVELFLESVQASSLWLLLAMELALFVTTLLVWRADGWPGTELVRGPTPD